MGHILWIDGWWRLSLPKGHHMLVFFLNGLMSMQPEASHKGPKPICTSKNWFQGTSLVWFHAGFDLDAKEIQATLQLLEKFHPGAGVALQCYYGVILESVIKLNPVIALGLLLKDPR